MAFTLQMPLGFLVMYLCVRYFGTIYLYFYMSSLNGMTHIYLSAVCRMSASFHLVAELVYDIIAYHYLEFIFSISLR